MPKHMSLMWWRSLGFLEDFMPPHVRGGKPSVEIAINMPEEEHREECSADSFCEKTTEMLEKLVEMWEAEKKESEKEIEYKILWWVITKPIKEEEAEEEGTTEFRDASEADDD